MQVKRHEAIREWIVEYHKGFGKSLGRAEHAGFFDACERRAEHAPAHRADAPHAPFELGFQRLRQRSGAARWRVEAVQHRVHHQAQAMLFGAPNHGAEVVDRSMDPRGAQQ
ncbi:MAG: hypothetical protein RL385_6077 [Pseudomonadota bacterium]